MLFLIAYSLHQFFQSSFIILNDHLKKMSSTRLSKNKSKNQKINYMTIQIRTTQIPTIQILK